MRLDEGQAAPDFTLPVWRPGAADGTLTLSDLRGAPVVLFFYSQDGSPTCTDEAMAFSAALDDFAALGAAVLGISPDSIAAHGKFGEKRGLRMPLLSDAEKTVCAAYGVWVEKQMFGNRYMGVERTTLLIDAGGQVVRVWRKVRIKGHVEAVRDAVGAL